MGKTTIEFFKKKIKKLGKKRFIGLILLLSLLFLSRLWRLDLSARFIWDESYDLLRMKQIYENRQITLVGPISQDNVNIYGSLTYYMLLPFALLSGFDPIGSAIGAAFYGIITVLISAFLITRWFGWQFWLPLLFLTFSYPLVQSGRWAWNPNLVPFWQALALVFYHFGKKNEDKKTFFFFISGLFLSLSIHNHWYAAFPIFGVLLIIFYKIVKTKRKKSWLFYLLGIFSGILPFILFDLTHPPGLFLSRMLYFSPLAPGRGGFNVSSFIPRFLSIFGQFFNYLFQSNILAGIFLALSILCFAFNKIKGVKLSYLKFLFPFFTVILGLSLIGGEVYQHYYLPGVLFFLFFIFSKERKRRANTSQYFLIFIFFSFSIYSSTKEVLSTGWSKNIRATRGIVDILETDINSLERKDSNLVVLESPDPNTKGKRYRDLLSIRGISLLPEDNYRDNGYLYVISFARAEEVKKSASYEVDRVKNLNPTRAWAIADSDWKIYRFDL